MRELKKQFRSLVEANKANALYQRAEADWSRGRLQSAFKFMRRAAEAGMVAAFETLAQFYDFGTGTNVNRGKALYWYRRAYRQGSDSAATNIGCIMRDRHQRRSAIAWWHRAIALGDDEANLNIAKLYLQNKDDRDKAARYLARVMRSAWTTEGGKEEAGLLLRQLRLEKTKQGRSSIRLR
jgi:TPR repeat protein